MSLTKFEVLLVGLRYVGVGVELGEDREDTDPVKLKVGERGNEGGEGWGEVEVEERGGSRRSIEEEEDDWETGEVKEVCWEDELTGKEVEGEEVDGKLREERGESKAAARMGRGGVQGWEGGEVWHDNDDDGEYV